MSSGVIRQPVLSLSRLFSAIYEAELREQKSTMSSCSEAESQFGDVEEEIQSTDRQQEELSERSNAGTTVNGAVVSTVHLSRSWGSADASTGSRTTELTSVEPRPCRSGGGQAATCEDAESFGGYDGRRPWMSELEYTAIVAEPPTPPTLSLLPAGEATPKFS